jgi:hypothetical protein
MKQTILFLFLIVLLQGCTENYSVGERVGTITQFSTVGLLWKSWEGHLNSTQTGMNSATPFDFSIDNDVNDTTLIKTIDSAATFGWVVKLKYHKTWGKNWFNNRGKTDFFVTQCIKLGETRSDGIINK